MTVGESPDYFVLYSVESAITVVTTAAAAVRSANAWASATWAS